MMKLRVFIIVSLLALSALRQVSGCGWATYSAREYYTFRIVNNFYPSNSYYYYYSDEENVEDISADALLNCEGWQELTSKKIDPKDIYRVVYKYSIAEMTVLKDLVEKSIKPDQDMMSNSFVAWLVDHKDLETIDFLILAKECEYVRSMVADPWFYPTKDKEFSSALLDISQRALSYKGERLKERYMLQAVRALFSLGYDEAYEECLTLWNNNYSDAPKSYIVKKIESYVAGVYYRHGDYPKAMEHYASSEDVVSFWWCLDDQSSPKDVVERIEMLYEYNPNAAEFARYLQDAVSHAENNAAYYDVHGIRLSDDRDKYIRLRDLALRLAQDGKNDNPAMWQYAAAYITELDGNPQHAYDMILRAKSMKGSDLVKESIRIYGIYLDALVSPCNAAFESRILSELRWLDDKIVNNITPKIRKTAYNGYLMYDHYSFYYYNDMMRKITVSALAPKYIELGKTAQAAALVGMADERLKQVIGVSDTTDYWYYSSRNIREKGKHIDSYRRYRWEEKRPGYRDFSNNLFEMLDTVKIEEIVDYRDLLFSKNISALDRFLTDRCYKSRDYLNDIIGTRLLRESRYKEAVHYLKDISVEYQSTLNTDEYLDRDPFYPPWINWKNKADNLGSTKLNFARQMYGLEQDIKATRDPELKARLQYRYAIGLCNSSRSGSSWAMAYYSTGVYERYSPDTLYLKTAPLIIEAMNTTQNREFEAICLFALAYLSMDGLNSKWNEKTSTYDYFIKKESQQALYFDLLFKRSSSTKTFGALYRSCDYLGMYSDSVAVALK